MALFRVAVAVAVAITIVSHYADVVVAECSDSEVREASHDINVALTIPNLRRYCRCFNQPTLYSYAVETRGMMPNHYCSACPADPSCPRSHSLASSPGRVQMVTTPQGMASTTTTPATTTPATTTPTTPAPRKCSTAQDCGSRSRCVPGPSCSSQGCFTFVCQPCQTPRRWAGYQIRNDVCEQYTMSPPSCDNPGFDTLQDCLHELEHLAQVSQVLPSSESPRFILHGQLRFDNLGGVRTQQDVQTISDVLSRAISASIEEHSDILITQATHSLGVLRTAEFVVHFVDEQRAALAGRELLAAVATGTFDNLVKQHAAARGLADVGQVVCDINGYPVVMPVTQPAVTTPTPNHVARSDDTQSDNSDGGSSSGITKQSIISAALIIGAAGVIAGVAIWLAFYRKRNEVYELGDEGLFEDDLDSQVDNGFGDVVMDLDFNSFEDPSASPPRPTR